MKSLSSFSLSVLTLAVTAATPAFAAEEKTKELPVVVATAKRVQDAQSNINASTTVITRGQIEQQQVSTLKDILQQQAGISLAGNGGPLTSTGIFMRGGSSKQVLILVDGVRVNDANQGAFDYSLIRADDIERVEIVRGPYSSQYGSDAVAGVIQIFTRKHTPGVTLSTRLGRIVSSDPDTSLGLGERKHSLSSETTVGFGLGDKKNGLSLGLSVLETDGFSATNKKSYSFNPDADGGIARTARLAGWSQLSSNVGAKFSSSWKNSQPEFDNGLSDGDFGTASAELSHAILDNWMQRLQIGWTRTNLDTNGRKDGYYTHFLTERKSASWQHEVTWAEGFQLVAGIDGSDEDAVSKDLIAKTTAFDQSLQNIGYFVSQYVNVGDFSASLSARQDKHDTFGEHSTGNVTLGYQLLPELKVYGAYGSAFRAPSANDLFHPGYTCYDASWMPIPGSHCYAGNPNLKPERSRQSELGIQFEWLQGQQLRLSAYRNIVRDLIAGDQNSPFNQININRARLQGIELDASGKVDQLSYSFNVASLSAEDGNGKDLARRPQGALNGSLAYSPLEQVSVGAEVRARSTAKDGSKQIPGYTTGNLFTTWQATPDLTLGARLENLSNKIYEEAYGYNTAPRTAYISVSYALR